MLGLDAELRERTLSSSALGDNTMHDIEAVGRLTIDLFMQIKAAYKLPSYSLDAVSEALLSEADALAEGVDLRKMEMK
jgi:DNA polymerase elongation subunit (family B)